MTAAYEDTLAAHLAYGVYPVADAVAMAGEVCASLASRRRPHGALSPGAVVRVVGRWEVDFSTARGGDERDDVRAVGALVAAMATGEGGVAGAMRLPTGVRAPVLRSLHVQPERRQGTVAELAEALGVPVPAAPRRARRVGGVLAAVVVAGLFGAVQRAPATGHALAPVATVAAEELAPVRRTLVIPRFDSPDGTDDRWLGEGVAGALATTLAERPGLEVVRRGAADLRVDGVVERDAEGLVVHLRVVDVAAEATLAAERRVLRGPLLVELDAVATRIAASLRAGDGPGLLALTTGSADAYRAYVEGSAGAGDAARLRRAATLDPSFFQPRLALASTEPAELEAAAALVGRAGRRGALALALAGARTPVARLVALEAQRADAPHDAAVAAALAAAYRAAGRVADCADEAGRAVSVGVGGASADLAWCRAALGDAAGALEAARGAGDPLLVGDVSLFLGRVGDARVAYARAGGAAARQAYVAARADARCPTERIAVASLEDARAAAATYALCSDPEGARAVEDALRRAGEPLGDELALARAAARGENGSYAKLEAVLAGAANDPVDRGRRRGALLAAARAEGRAAEALAGFAPEPMDRAGLFEPPLLYEVALTQLAAGDVEAAALSCGELEGWISAMCRGRVAEDAGKLGEAFREYRELLDRWADAGESYRPARDAARRLRAVVARAREARQ